MERTELDPAPGRGSTGQRVVLYIGVEVYYRPQYLHAYELMSLSKSTDNIHLTLCFQEILFFFPHFH